LNDDQIELGVEDEDDDEEEILEIEGLLELLFVFLGTDEGVFSLIEVTIPVTCLGAGVYAWVLT
jgi:hypothetical protein